MTTNHIHFDGSVWRVLGCLLISAGISQAGDSANEWKAPAVQAVFPPGGQRGSKVSVRISGSSGTPAPQIWTSAGQLDIELAADGKTATIGIPFDATTGVHWFRFHNSVGASARIPFIVGLVTESNETEPNDRPGEASVSQSASSTVNGVIQKTGDVDLHGVDLQKGQTLVCSVVANRILGSPMDAVLQIVNEEGLVLDQNDDDHQLDPQITFVAPEEGTYYARLFAFPSKPNSSIRLAGAPTYVYRITLTTEGFVDYTLPIRVDGAPSNLVRLFGWNLPEQLKSVKVSPLKPQTFFVRRGVAVGVSIPRSKHRSFNESVTERLVVPFSVSGVIQKAGESDEYEFAATGGSNLKVSVDARSLFSSLDPVLTITSASGKVIKTSDDRSRTDFDSELTVRIPDDGDYVARVQDRFDSAGDRHFYLLSAEIVKPHAVLSVSDEAFVLKSGEELKIPVTINREGGHSETLNVSATGLPSFVEAETVVSQAKGDTAKKVTLIMSSLEGGSFSGQIQIHASDTHRTYIATSSLPATADRTDAVWLTVVENTTQPVPANRDGP